MNRDDCPNARNHTSCPKCYIQWHEWAKKKGKRHKQVRCHDCGLYRIWKRRAKDEPDYGGNEP